MTLRNFPVFLFLMILIVPLRQIQSASAHKHVHGKERTEDGAFSPRDHDHFGEEGLKESS